MKDKKAKKRDLSVAEDMSSSVNGLIANSSKKAKLTVNGIQHEEDPQANTSKSSNSVNVSIFEYFKDLTHEEEETRVKAGLHLLQQLSKTKEPEKRQKELNYTLKRLVRGCGAATNNSRSGFYSVLVAFLTTVDSHELPLQQVFDVMHKELHVGTTIVNKEDADAVVGKILVCGALQHAGRLETANHENLEHIANTLLQASRQRSYHASLSYSILLEIAEKLTLEQFSTAVWPIVQIELQRPWSKQTLQTVYCLISLQRNFPTLVNKKFIKTNFGDAELFNAESYAYLYKIFWDNTNLQLLTNPALELCAEHLATSPNLFKFWSEHVDVGLQNHSRVRQLETLKMATDMLNYWQKTKTPHTSPVTGLLSDNFMHTLVEGLKNLKQKKDQTVAAFYEDFFEALVSYCVQISEDSERVAVIQRLILHPGIFCIEKYTKTRVVHQIINALNESGVKEIFDLYKRIFLDQQPKNCDNASETWLNFERLNAGYILQHLLSHKSVRSALKWRGTQLRFLLTCGIFHVDSNVTVCKKESAASFSKEFGEQCKNMFFMSLQNRVADLQQEQKLLLRLVQFCNEHMEQKQAAKYFRIKQYDETMHNYWRKMFNAVCGAESGVVKLKKNAIGNCGAGPNDKLQLVFNLLLLNMGLQLFREPEMAGPAIEDLIKCMERVKHKQEHKKGGKHVKPAEESEPEWIEVVVDLFLHLLSHNTSSLRNIVNAIFPHFCGSLNLSAVHQILAMLDMKDGQNPLSAKGDDDDSENDDDDNDDENQGVHTIKAGKKGKEAMMNGSVEQEAKSDDDEEDDDDDDDDDEDDDADDDDDDDDEDIDEVTDTDKLRNAISLALIENGGASLGVDDDMESIDLNDMSEEQGLKLDEALAAAFKSMKKSGGASKKKSKNQRVKLTTVMHFRIRVIDLIEIYLQQKPTLLITIEIMLALFDMLQYCISDELRPLQIKVEKLLQKLTSLKTFEQDKDLAEKDIVEFIRLILDKKSPAAAFESMNKGRNKCIIFLINTVNKFEKMLNSGNSQSKTGEQVLGLCQEYLQEFILSRNPTVNITLLLDMFRLRWRGVWDLAVTLAQRGITMQTRVFRRIQIYELLDVLYKNNELQQFDISTAKTKLEKIEKALSSHIKQLASSVTDGTQLSAKEYTSLLQLLLIAQKINTRLQLRSALAQEDVCAAIQSMRTDSTQLYQRYCTAYKLTVVRNVKKSMAEKKHEKNKVSVAIQREEDVNNDEYLTLNSTDAKPQKHKKTHDKVQRNQRKMKKQQRLQAASKGINGVFGFAQTSAHSDADDEDADEEMI